MENAVEANTKRGRRKKKALHEEFEHQLREVILYNLRASKVWSKGQLVKQICSDLGVPTYGSYQLRAQQLLDQIVCQYYVSILSEFI